MKKDYESLPLWKPAELAVGDCVDVMEQVDDSLSVWRFYRYERCLWMFFFFFSPPFRFNVYVHLWMLLLYYRRQWLAKLMRLSDLWLLLIITRSERQFISLHDQKVISWPSLAIARQQSYITQDSTKGTAGYGLSFLPYWSGLWRLKAACERKARCGRSDGSLNKANAGCSRY